MPYVEHRLIHDADAHVVETPDWFMAYADPDIRGSLKPLYVATVRPVGEGEPLDASDD